MFLVQLRLSNSSCPFYEVQIMVIVFVVESLFSKVTGEFTAFYNTVESFVTCIGIFLKNALLEISISSLITKATGLQSTSCSPTKKNS